MSLPTNFVDDILDTEENQNRIYTIKKKADGSVVESDVYLEETTVYSQTGSNFGATQINETNEAVNELSSNLTDISLRYDSESGKPQWKERGADTWNPFNSVKDSIHIKVYISNAVAKTSQDPTNRWMPRYAEIDIPLGYTRMYIIGGSGNNQTDITITTASRTLTVAQGGTISIDADTDQYINASMNSRDSMAQVWDIYFYKE